MQCALAASCGLRPAAGPGSMPAAPSHVPARWGRAPGRPGVLTRSYNPTDREQQPLVPAAPPVRAPPPPPPPPPDDPDAPTGDVFISRRGFFGVIGAASVGWWFALRGDYKPVAVDPTGQIVLLKTRGGNTVVATQDAAGRTFMFDRAGNIYYDTEDPRTGMYIVDALDGTVYNKYVDRDGKVQTAAVGNIADLKTFEVREVGNVPIEEWQKSVKGFKGGNRVTGFVTPPDPNDVTSLMPPTAPAELSRDGKSFRPPAFLEDYEVELEPKRGFFGLGGGPRVEDQDPVELLNSLKMRGEK